MSDIHIVKYEIVSGNRAIAIFKDNYVKFRKHMQDIGIPYFMHLAIYVNSTDVELLQKYKDSALEHYNKMTSDPFYDAGFDIFLPSRTYFDMPLGNKVDFQIQCSATVHSTHDFYKYYSPFYTYSRSSISKTPLRLSNQQGIIDAGYRGNLIGMFDRNSDITHVFNKYSRLLQICAPNLMPIFVEIVPTFEDLGQTTQRGTNGIGSTGV